MINFQLVQFLQDMHQAILALAGFKTWVCLIDYVKTAFATDNLAVAVTVLQRFQRATNFHGGALSSEV